MTGPRSRRPSLGLLPLLALLAILAVVALPTPGPKAETETDVDDRSIAADRPWLMILGIAQDGGVPQAGTKENPSWRPDGFRRLATSLALIAPTDDGPPRRYLFEATPDFREQLARLDAAAPRPDTPGLDGIFLTHAHIGHYTGLMFLGHESMGARGVPVWAMPRMAEYLRTSGPWSQLVRYENITLRPLGTDEPVRLEGGIEVHALPVPHRQEFSEVVAYRIVGPPTDDGTRRSALFVPDIDAWDQWDDLGYRLEDLLRTVDIAYLDATFFADGEVPGRDMSGFPHPRIRKTLARVAPLPASERAKVRLIHLNHTNPALVAGSEARREIEAAGVRVAEEGERFGF